jgi:hypothetical protein
MIAFKNKRRNKGVIKKRNLKIETENMTKTVILKGYHL